jgi:hypothetical protein
VVQRPHGKNAERNVGARHLSGDGVDGSVAAARNHELAPFSKGSLGQSANVVAALCHDDLDLDAALGRGARDLRLGFLDMDGMAVEDAKWAIHLRLPSIRHGSPRAKRPLQASRPSRSGVQGETETRNPDQGRIIVSLKWNCNRNGRPAAVADVKGRGTRLQRVESRLGAMQE